MAGAVGSAGLTFGVVGTVEEIANDPQALAAGILRPLADTGMMTVDSPFTLAVRTRCRCGRRRGMGSTTAPCCGRSGYSEAEIDALRAAGTILGG